jgi:ABC-type cobalamin/Fe3+-siderophores transport system ATPase subunit
MSLDKIKSSEPINNFAKEDYFNFISKSEFISDLLTDHSDIFQDNSMIALYGEWGSGKTSILENIKRYIEDAKGDVVFFEAWMLEKDEDLSISLLNMILDKFKEDKINEIRLRINVLAKTMFAKGISILNEIIKDKTTVDIEALIAATSSDEYDEYEHSYYKKVQEFKNTFNEILSYRKSDKPLVVIIDDLDRCEPKNVLRLLSDIKLFFSYSDNIIYLCGIDKNAVEKAIKHVYGDVIKSSEYLEKIFTISFSVPTPTSVKSMIEHYFNGEDADYINSFFNYIQFTRPRHIKKVLNKYMILKKIKEAGIDRENLIPILSSDNLFYQIIVLYMIIIHEFYPELYMDSLINIDNKFNNFNEKTIQSSKIQEDIDFIRRIQYSLDNDLNLKHLNIDKLNSMLHLFLPSYRSDTLEMYIKNNTLSSTVYGRYIKQFINNNNETSIKFYCFLVEDMIKYGRNGIEIKITCNDRNYNMLQLTKMVNLYF